MFDFDAKDGTLNSIGNITYTNTIGETIIKEYSDVILNSGHTMTISNPARALIITSQGNITINGTVNLDYKGGYGDRYLTVEGVNYDLLGGLGGDGGSTYTDNLGGKVDSGLRCAGGMRGGGGDGGKWGTPGRGGRKNTPFDLDPTSYVDEAYESSSGSRNAASGENGAGGGGAATGLLMSGTWGAYAGPARGIADGGASGGGGAIHVRSSTGFHNAGGSTRPTAGLTGGGVLVLLARGNITINGQILARGINGGPGGAAYQINAWDAGGGCGGGGSGGGRVLSVYRGSYSNSGIVTLTGGAGGLGGSGYDGNNGIPGSAGATGTISSFKVSVLGPEDPTTFRAKATSLNRATLLNTMNKIYVFDGANGTFNSDFNIEFSNTWGETFIRSYQNFTLNAGHIITLLYPARAFIILSQNDITINGRIDLDYSGGMGDRYLEVNGVNYDLLGGLGGNGGNGGESTSNGGTIDTYYRCAGGMRGGGGGGGGPSGGRGGFKNTSFNMVQNTILGKDITVGSSELDAQDGYNGLGGGGGADAYFSATGARLRGGNSINNTLNKGAAHGGGGHIGVDTTNASFNAIAPEALARPANLTGGGVLVLIALGNIIINGEIWARGTGGGRGGHAYTGTDNYKSYGGGGGGGSGGGKLLVLYQTSFTNNGSILLTGGAGGLGGNGDGNIGLAGSAGLSGDNGSISSFQVDLITEPITPDLNIFLGNQAIKNIYLGLNRVTKK
jgi:hypothetical protein